MRSSMKKPSKPTFPLPDSDLQPERPPSRRKSRGSGLPRLKRAGLPTGKRSRPETPLLKWKIEDNEENGKERRKDQNDLDEEEREEGGGARRKGKKGREVPMSARKLAAGLWRLQLPETRAERRSAQQLGFQPDAGHIGAPFLRQRNSKGFASEAKDNLQSPGTTSRNGFLRKALVFDFQPKDPENIYAALAVLSGKAIPGVILTRKLSKLPRTKCWFVGSSKAGAIDKASEFNKVWKTHLRVGHHDCRNYTNGLVEYLTGEKYVLDCLRSTDTQK